jgi:hypothetical protein
MKVVILWGMLLLVGVSSYALWWSHYYHKEKAPVSHLQIETTNPPAGKSLLPEQRRSFALGMGKKFKSQGRDATITTTGDFHTSMLMKGTMVNEQFVVQMKDSGAINEMRNMGFKHLIMTDGKITWDVDLKN